MPKPECLTDEKTLSGADCQCCGGIGSIAVRLDCAAVARSLVNSEMIVIAIRDLNTKVLEYVGQIARDRFAELNLRLIEAYGMDKYTFEHWTFGRIVTKHDSDWIMIVAHLCLQPFVIGHTERQERLRIRPATGWATEHSLSWSCPKC